ncbi:MAG: flagellar biosynthesis protein FliQ [Lachnospiraceae bacterium]
MTIDDITKIAGQALYTICITAAPVLLVSLIVGLVVSIFQTVTSIQEQTLTFVPKILAIFVSLLIFGHWMLNTMVEFTANLWSDFTVYIR